MKWKKMVTVFDALQLVCACLLEVAGHILLHSYKYCRIALGLKSTRILMKILQLYCEFSEEIRLYAKA